MRMAGLPLDTPSSLLTTNCSSRLSHNGTCSTRKFTLKS